MAISLKAAGTWARNVSDPTGAITIPGTPSAGDRMFLFATWKDSQIDASVVGGGWTQVTGSPFRDSTTAAGNGTGGVRVACWYRDWQSGDTGPSIDWANGGVAPPPTEAGVVVMLWQKGASDTWGTPVTGTAAIAANTSFSASSSSTVAVPDNSVVMCLVGFRDDAQGTATRTATSIDQSASVLTFSGNYVESPATHWTSTTGLDMWGDLGHRFVTAGGTATLTTSGTQGGSETGAALWVVQGLSATTTSTAKISLAAGSTPPATTDHAIGIRARVTSGTGTINVALYEGANNRSGNLSQRLTTSLADYIIPISSANAANITSYANLDIWFWGTTNGPVTFEVDQVWLQAPEPEAPAATYVMTITGGGVATEVFKGLHNKVVVFTGGGVATEVFRGAHRGTNSETGGGVYTSVRRKTGKVTEALTGGGVYTSGGGRKGAKSTEALTGGGVYTYSSRHAGKVVSTATGGGVYTSSARKAASATAAITGGGTHTFVWTALHRGTLTATGGGVYTYAYNRAERHSGTMAITGGGTHTFVWRGAHRPIQTFTGGGVATVVGLKAARTSTVITGGGVYTFARSKGGLVTTTITGGGVYGYAARKAAKVLLTETGGGISSVTWAGAHYLEEFLATGGGVVRFIGSASSVPHAYLDMRITGGGVVAFTFRAQHRLVQTVTASGAVTSAHTSARSTSVARTASGVVSCASRKGALRVQGITGAGRLTFIWRGAHAGTSTATGGGVYSYAYSRLEVHHGTFVITGGGVYSSAHRKRARLLLRATGSGVVTTPAHTTARHRILGITGGGRHAFVWTGAHDAAVRITGAGRYIVSAEAAFTNFPGTVGRGIAVAGMRSGRIVSQMGHGDGVASGMRQGSGLAGIRGGSGQPKGGTGRG